MRPVVVLGAGGHAAVVIAALAAEGSQILGALDTDEARHGTSILGVDVLGGDALLEDWRPGEIDLANGLGGAGSMKARRELFTRFSGEGYRFRTVVHPHAWVAVGCEIAEGAQIMAGAVVQPRCQIGENAIVNTGAGIDHDCIVGAHVHIAPGATLAGGVVIGAGAVVGAGAVIIPDVEVGEDAFIAAGATVISNLAARARVAGTPAEIMR